MLKRFLFFLFLALAIASLWSSALLETTLRFNMDAQPFLTELELYQVGFDTMESMRSRINSLEIQVYRMERDIKDYFISVDKRYLQNFDQEVNQFSAEIRSFYSAPLPDEHVSAVRQRILDQIARDATQYQLHYHQMQQLVQDGKKGDAMRISRTEQLKVANRLIASLKELDNFYLMQVAEVKKTRKTGIENWFVKFNTALARAGQTLHFRVYGIYAICLGIGVLCFLLSYLFQFNFLNFGKKDTHAAKGRFIMKEKSKLPVVKLGPYQDFGQKGK